MLYLAWLSALLLAVVEGQYRTGAGYGSVERGRIASRYNKNNVNQGLGLQDHQNRDLQKHDGTHNRNAVWTGRAGERDNAYRRNEQQFRDQAAGRRQDYANDNKNFGNIVQQIRDEGLKNAYRIDEATRYNRNDQDQANGYNAANAGKNAYERANNLQHKINYKFNKKFDKHSSESGGYEDQNGRTFSKLDLIDEREKDDAIKRVNNAVKRKQNDQQQAIKEGDWRANSNQAQAQGGQFGFVDKRLEAAGEKSDDRSIDYSRKDNQYRENEQGVDSALREAKDLAHQAAGYRNEAQANAEAARAVKDNKYYGGAETGKKAGVNHGQDYGVSGPDGPTSRDEGSGGRVKSGFNEVADQKERGEELARAFALSSADARNEYNRLKDRVVFDEVRGLKDHSQGAFRQGLSDSANQGYSSNAAEAGKHASESDRNFAGAASTSDFAAQQNSLNEALRDRDYVLKKQNDESEIFLRSKQFFHNKKEGGANDESLKYDQDKRSHEFGAAAEADVAKQNQFARAHKDSKIATNGRNYEDFNARRAQLQHLQDDYIESARGNEEREDEEAARAGANANAYERKKVWENADDSRSEEFQNKQALWDTAQARQSQDREADKHAKNVQADVETVTTGSNGPFGNVDSQRFLGGDALSTGQLTKRQKEHTIPQIQIDIKPVARPIKSEPPKKRIQIPELPPVQPVKAYQPPKYNKKEVDYNTHEGRPSKSRNRFRGSQYLGNFQRINSGLFSRPINSFSRIGTNILGRANNRGAATSAFRKPRLSFSSRGRTSIGSLNHQPQRFHNFGGGIH